MSWLDRLLGSWELEMDHADMTEPVTGRHHYERVLDGAWVLLRWSYDHPDFPDAMALLSEDRYHYFDVRGIKRTFDIEVDGDGDGDGWSMTNLAGDLAQRTATRFVGADALDTKGERSFDAGATWEPDFTMRLRRVATG